MQMDTSTLLSILQQVGANPPQNLNHSTQPPDPARSGPLPRGPPAGGSVAALMQEAGVKLIHPSSSGSRPPSSGQPGISQSSSQQSARMETPQLAGDGGPGISSQMMALMQKLTG